MSCNLARLYALKKQTLQLLNENDMLESITRNSETQKMIVEPIATGGNFLKPNFIKAQKILELIISDARTIQEVTFKGKDGKPDQKKIECHVTYKNMQKGDPDIWTINSKSRNTLIATWGSDSDKWVNRPIPITLAGENEMIHILVDAMRIV